MASRPTWLTTRAAIGTAAYQERGIQIVARDLAAATKVRTNLLDAGEQYVIGVGVEVYEGRVLLTGILPNEEMRATAVSLTCLNVKLSYLAKRE